MRRSRDGLSTAEVGERTAAGRVNSVPTATSRSAGEIIQANVFTLFNAVVGGCFILLLVLGQWRDALFGLSAVSNSLIGIIQEYRAKRSLDQLAILQAARNMVVRNGAREVISSEDLVPDDLVLLNAGDQVTADLLLIGNSPLEVDESLLTGESEPVPKQDGAVLLSGSLILAGNGQATVLRVGPETSAYRLAAEARRFSLVTSEIRRSLEKVFTVITWLLLPVALLLTNAQMQDQGGWGGAMGSGRWVPAVVGAVAGIMAMIPLGLLLMTSVAFAVGGLRLARQKVLIQELAAVEVLARVDVLCLDKTGTLSSGSMVFDAVHHTGDVCPPGWRRAVEWFGASPDASSTAAAIGAAFPAEIPLTEQDSVPFSSARKWSSVTFAPESAAPGTWVLGAPDSVLGSPGCGKVHGMAVALASTGLRTLALAHLPGPLPPDAAGTDLPPELVPVLLLTFRESIRADAAATLDYFRRQGVTVKIISGDDPRTVAALARGVGFGTGTAYDARTLPGDPLLLEEVVESQDLFGSVTPSQKRDLVQALKRRGHTVAMTGDGVNDVLALKEADLGIAMDSASPATKAVARMVLLDGRFERLPAVVDEGRRAISNIERVSLVFLSKTVYATVISVVTGILLLAFPFLPRQLSALDGLTIGLPAFFLALQPGGQRYAAGFLRRSLTFAVPAGTCTALCVLAVSAYGQLWGGHSLASAQSAATITLGLVAAWILVMASRPLNWTKVLILAGMYAGLVLLFSLPLTQDFFRVEWPPSGLLAVSVAVAVAGCLAIEIVGRFTRRPSTPARGTGLGPLALEPDSREGDGGTAGQRDGPAST
ncbi:MULTISPECIES: HAD-IC family P-type ATPase [Pseudarthrobacter]|uniref:Cation-transporting ATPase E n=1 Tax=Pseudarthrobacter niigatensis TaxID=369935 RepID=A0AAJ1SQP9_9MICC|nr:MULTISPECIES: HAD-IC family P-type ATPase [Pseudarthrobacter]MDQ0144244.1 cation-transporting ATPase E [Pseudarthrobacter niigatensis]MDQ0266504.1 cation-transporting ATPase E [Pseudarthrobacter niigatensis]QDG63330.1 HAD-IC family P-type ATPase [Pseudarthrobacter sp. NIBRBAC000502771]QDG88554.1 HAD-IC family P-type ATPase [Pseudarthrobacter sp. NIBRBAC000502770]